MVRKLWFLQVFLMVIGLFSPAAPAGELSAVPLSSSTLAVGLALDRDGAALVTFNHQPRPFFDPGDPPEIQPLSSGKAVQVELVLQGPGEGEFTRRIEIPGLCLEHSPQTPPHVLGDTIQLHHESLVAEFPDLSGYDHLEVAVYHPGAGSPVRQILGVLTLSPEKGLDTVAPLGTVHWPEEYGETERYRVYGTEAEVPQRINIVLVPDGYTHAQKALMEQHALAVVNHFRGKTPFLEHDLFFNYILVYAYSNQDATDQCDCSVLRDTAMNTRFPNDGYPCGDSGNRCLYYGWGCDPNNYTDANITAAELRAPAKDVTLVMVNTTRYGGCGGYRAVYAAGNSQAAEIAVHELGHSLAGLADEYISYSTCGTSAGNINTSLDAETGAWPEWISEIGKPFEGAQYYAKCIYRPVDSCEMRALNRPFCPVCNQRWSLITFGHWRVSPSAPISGKMPASPVETQTGRPVDFSVQTRLSSGSAKNDIVWKRQGPADPEPVVVASDTTSFSGGFVPAGDHTLTCEVTADTNFVKPSKTGANRDQVSWIIHARPIPEVSSAGDNPLTVELGPGGRLNLGFQDVGAMFYNLYVSNRPGTHPFQVVGPSGGKKDCHVSPLVPAGSGRLGIQNYDAEAGITGPKNILFLLVTADNGPGTETGLGRDSSGVERAADARCAP